MKRSCIALLFFILLYRVVFGFESINSQYPLKDPKIPDGERAVYTVENKNSTFKVEEFVKISRDKRYYIVKSITQKTIKVLKLSRKTMLPLQLDITTDKKEYKIRSKRQIEYKEKAKKDTIRIIGNFDTKYVLRGFPFENPTPLIIEFLTESEAQNSSSFQVSAHFVGKEDVIIGGRVIPSYILEIRYRVSGFLVLFKSMLPRTKIWYSIEKPHYMVKYENKGGRGGSEETRILLTDYSGWKK